MSADNRSTESPRSESENTEARMRLALGLREGPGTDHHPPQQRADQARPKHRFAKDGEVPVVVLHSSRREQETGASPRNRLVSLEASLQAERTARAAAERQLSEALASVQSLRTKLAHAELAHREALDASVATRELVEHALSEALAAKVAPVEPAMIEPAMIEPAMIEPAIADAGMLDSEAADVKAAEPKKIEAKKRIAKAPRKAAAPRTRQAKPVKWWLPGYKAAAKTS